MAKSKDAKKVVYSFPTKSRCPHCGSIDTQAYSTQGKVQYRKCLRIGCRRNYIVIGSIVKHKKEKEFKDGKKPTHNPDKAKPKTTDQPGKNKRETKPAAAATRKKPKGE